MTDADARVAQLLQRREKRRASLAEDARGPAPLVVTAPQPPAPIAPTHQPPRLEQPRSYGRVRPRQHRSRVASTLGATLRDATAVSYFVQYMETQRHALVFLQFWLNAESYVQCMGDAVHREGETHYTVESLQADAMVIYNTYFSLQAPASHKFLQTLVCMDPNAAEHASTEERMQELRVHVENNICQSAGPDADCFVEAQELCMEVLERLYYPKFELSTFYSQYLLEVLGAGDFTLQDVLHTPQLRDCFALFMASAKVVPFEGTQPGYLLQLWISVQSFQEIVYQYREGLGGTADASVRRGSVTLEALQTAAVALYDRFVSWQAYNPVQVPADIRRSVEMNVSRADGPQIDCFEAAQRYAFELMDEHFFGPFVRSETYARLVRTLSDRAALPKSPFSPSPHLHRPPAAKSPPPQPRAAALPAQQTVVDTLFLDADILRNRMRLMERLQELLPQLGAEPSAAASNHDDDWTVDGGRCTVVRAQTPPVTTPHGPRQLTRTRSRLTDGLVDEWGAFRSFSSISLESPRSTSFGKSAAQALGLAMTDEEERQEQQRAKDIAHRIVLQIVRQTSNTTGTTEPS